MRREAEAESGRERQAAGENEKLHERAIYAEAYRQRCQRDVC